MEREEKRQQAEWERARFICVNLMNIQIDKKHRMRKYTDLVLFPWERPAKALGRNDERAEWFAEKLERIEKRHGKGK